ncbi:hypothetical protein LJB93_01500 [Desulfovibrio sp. OttesenSCG-928-F07]|nr:hypothetical protein [Desulfovibrio sp. OttesenSCG-928-F07]
MAPRKDIEPLDYITRGILVGGAFGVFAGLLGITRSAFWGCGLGMLAGFLAGMTLARRAKNKKD